MKLQISSRLAIFALIELASEPERQISVSEIGEKYGVSAHHLAKVMHTLGRVRPGSGRSAVSVVATASAAMPGAQPFWM